MGLNFFLCSSVHCAIIVVHQPGSSPDKQTKQINFQQQVQYLILLLVNEMSSGSDSFKLNNANQLSSGGCGRIVWSGLNQLAHCPWAAAVAAAQEQKKANLALAVFVLCCVVVFWGCERHVNWRTEVEGEVLKANGYTRM